MTKKGNATEVKPGVFVANTSTSIFRGAPAPPKAPTPKK
jgi:hypothetical protein